MFLCYLVSMYIRQVRRKNKDGSTVTYVQLAHNERDPKTGHPRANVLYSFGRADELDVEALKRLVKSISRFLSPEDALAVQAEVNGKDGFRFVRSRPLGGAWVLDALWKAFGIDQVFERLLKGRNVRTPVERAIFSMVANRALDPSSKRRVETWVQHDVAIPDVDEIPLHQLYRAMDVLLESEGEIQKEVYFQVADLLNLEVDLLYFDTTSTYFEIEPDPEDDADVNESGRRERPKTLRQWGHSKDGRPLLPQVVIGLAVTRDGIPVRCWVWPGNTMDMTVIKQVKEDLVGWKLGRVISVVDRGFASEENLRTLQRTGGHYIAGERMRSGKAAVEEALSRKGRYQTVRDNLHVKEIVIGDGEARHRYILVRNPEQAKRDRLQRQKLVEKLERELEQLKHLDGGQHTKAVCALTSHPVYGRYLGQTKTGKLRIDRAKVKAEERFDGKYLLRTSDDTLSPEDVALGYKQLLEVEAAFRTLKHSLDLRPMYHRIDDRIRSHALLCWLALLLVRIVEIRTKKTWSEVRDILQRMHLGEFVSGDSRVFQRTETTRDQAEIFDLVGVSAPPRFAKIEPGNTKSA